MTIYAQWHGGSSYSYGGIEDRETFPSLRAAREALCSRRDSGHWMPQTFAKITGTDTALTPCVDETSYLDLYATETSDDLIGRLEFGPRGGVVKHGA